ncbi:MAG TPA: nitrate/nitrite transporter NrtS [Elainellaceae cyanobacterium]
MKEFLACLVDKKLMPTGLRVAAIVGSLLFAINHGSALIHGRMTRDRWISASLTYVVPYMVNIHGQYVSRARQRMAQR